MATYLILNLIFIAVVCLALRIRPNLRDKRLFITAAALLVLTAVFDNLIVRLGVVAYDPTKILGIYLGAAPIEDFMYALLAIILIPWLWHKFGNRYEG